MRGLGYKRDKPDARDRLFAAHAASAAPIPDFASVDVPSVAPKNQGQTSSCVGNSEAQALRLAYLRRGIACPELSAMSIYRGARNIDGTNTDEGTQLRSGMQAVTTVGVALESAWPFDEHAINSQLPFSALRSAYDRHGKRGYHRIAEGNVDDWCRALAGGLPCVSGWDVTEVFCSSDGRHVVDVQQGAMAGGHAIACIGYGSSSHLAATMPGVSFAKSYPRLFVLVNSWGHEWGFSGRFFATPEFVADASDSWVVDVGGAK